MDQSHVISALVEKRAELASQLKALNKPHRELANQIAQVDQVVAMLGHGLDPNAPPAPESRRCHLAVLGVSQVEELKKAIAVKYLRLVDD